MKSPSFDAFLCSTDEIADRIKSIDPKEYGETRNYLNGSVTWLSPFLTHGIINTSEIAQIVLLRHKHSACYKLLFELAWREYFHRTWQHAEHRLFDDIRNAQARVSSTRLPAAVVNATTGVHAVDQSLQSLFSDGVMHNHARMWVAAIVCNLAQTHWYEAARFFHYHLLDGDLASNTLSWQWVAGTFSHKQYVANQDNINKYSRSTQHDTWLDLPYDSLPLTTVPVALQDRADFHYKTVPFGEPIKKLTGKIALRSVWHLDPRWQSTVDQHIIFVDSKCLSKWPLSPNRVTFIEHWAKQCNAKITVGTVDQLRDACSEATVVRQEYPACAEWPGNPEPRTWLYPAPEKPMSSFSHFFKHAKGHVGL